MTPEEIKAKLEATDAQLRTKLSELGFTPEEIERQLDPAVPQAQKEAERKAVLERKFAADLADPKSGLMDAIVGKVAAQAEELLAKEEAARKQRRKKLLIGAGAAVVVAGAAIWYFALRDGRSRCEKLVGSVADIEAMTKRPMKMGHGFSGKYSCRQEVDSASSAGAYAVLVETENGDHFDAKRSVAGDAKYASHEMFGTAVGDAALFVAGDAKEVSTEELEAAAQARVGHSRDPIGDALGALPPAQHAVYMYAHGETITIELDRKMFTPAQAKAFAIAVAERAK